jgi:hypothetical protein
VAIFPCHHTAYQCHPTFIFATLRILRTNFCQCGIFPCPQLKKKNTLTIYLLATPLGKWEFLMLAFISYYRYICHLFKFNCHLLQRWQFIAAIYVAYQCHTTFIFATTWKIRATFLNGGKSFSGPSARCPLRLATSRKGLKLTLSELY